jgi:hypothetical protein
MPASSSVTAVLARRRLRGRALTHRLRALTHSNSSWHGVGSVAREGQIGPGQMGRRPLSWTRRQDVVGSADCAKRQPGLVAGIRGLWRVTVATAGQERRRDAETDQQKGRPAAGVRASKGSEEALKAPSQRLCLRSGGGRCGRREDDARRRDITIFLRRLRGELSGSGGEIARPLSWLHPKTVLDLQIS